MSEWKSNIPEGLDLDVKFSPIRPDNVHRGKSKAKKIAKTIKSLHQNANGPYAEWKSGRTAMARERIIQSNKSRDPLKQSEACRKATLKSLKDPKVLENRAKGRENKWVKYQDPNGKIWNSRKDAALAWNIIPQTLSQLAKNPKSGWKKLI
jgi:hypothetical protein